MTVATETTLISKNWNMFWQDQRKMKWADRKKKKKEERKKSSKVFCSPCYRLVSFLFFFLSHLKKKTNKQTNHGVYLFIFYFFIDQEDKVHTDIKITQRHLQTIFFVIISLQKRTSSQIYIVTMWHGRTETWWNVSFLTRKLLLSVRDKSICFTFSIIRFVHSKKSSGLLTV